MSQKVAFYCLKGNLLCVDMRLFTTHVFVV